MKPRFLFFLYHYPPSPGTAARRNHLISSEILKRYPHSRIFTASRPSAENREPSIKTIHSYDYRSLLKKRTKDGAVPEVKKQNKVMQSLVKILNTFPASILLGEGGLYYFLSLIRKGQQAIRNDAITHIYSSFRPFADHYAAYKLKKRNPDVVWIADFRDLIIDPHYQHILFQARHHAFFKKIFSKADLLTTVSDGLAEKLSLYNPSVLTVRNGIQGIPDHIEPVHCKYFKIAYTGSMFLDKRNAEPVFRSLVRLDRDGEINIKDVRIIYAGKDGALWSEIAERYSVTSIFVDKGIVDHDESSSIQRNACINLLLTISSGKLQGVLTGKLTEYFAAGSPVLGIIAGQNDQEINSILTEVEIGQSFSDQENELNAIKAFIHAEYIYWKQTGMNRKPVRVDVLKEKYSTEVTMRRLFDFISHTTHV